MCFLFGQKIWFKISYYPLGKLTWLAGKWTWIEDVFPIENGDFPASHVSLLKCSTYQKAGPQKEIASSSKNLFSGSGRVLQSFQKNAYNQ